LQTSVRFSISGVTFILNPVIQINSFLFNPSDNPFLPQLLMLSESEADASAPAL